MGRPASQRVNSVTVCLSRRRVLGRPLIAVSVFINASHYIYRLHVSFFPAGCGFIWLRSPTDRIKHLVNHSSRSPDPNRLLRSSLCCASLIRLHQFPRLATVSGCKAETPPQRRMWQCLETLLLQNYSLPTQMK